MEKIKYFENKNKLAKDNNTSIIDNEEQHMNILIFCSDSE